MKSLVKLRDQAKTVLLGKIPAESALFEQNFTKILEIRKELLAIDAGVKKWIASSKELGKSAKLLSKTVRTPQRDLDALSAEMDTLLEAPTHTILPTLGKKIALLDALVKQRNHLKELRQNKENYEKKLAQLEEQDRAKKRKNAALAVEFDVQINTVKHKIATCTEKYQAELTEVAASIEHILEECGTGMGPKLVAPELASFRANQYAFFVLCQKLIAGEVESAEALDLETQWREFQRKNSTTVANARVQRQELADGEAHVKWNPVLLIEEIASPNPVPSASLIEEEEEGPKD